MTDAAQTQSAKGHPGTFFAIAFIWCTITAVTLLGNLPEGYWTAWRNLTMAVTTALGTVLGIATSGTGDVLTVNGFAMRIIRQCTAADYIVIVASAMLLYVRHRIGYRLLGVVVAVPVIVLANACRLMVTGVIGSVSVAAFNLFHDYLWVIAFALLVFSIWKFWVDGGFSVSKDTARRVGQVIAVSLAAYALLLLLREPYGKVLAATSSTFYRLLSHETLSAIILDGEVMVYRGAEVVIPLDNMMEQVNQAIYLGLMFPLQKKGDWQMAGMTLFGAGFIFVLSAFFITMGCLQAVASGELGLFSFLAIGSVVHLALPMSIYWIIASLRSPGPEAEVSL
ncbi:archaeosortase/exosortase family protein [Geomonas oryzisoli]|uniref:Archaeosortase/exosortase family protein n=1 Tax=Geomonas oryzisoli TaxID=2847992 RepID=A0ABX8J8H4_9BACT|nr:exosortase/archaeosortase family protein [Geomonas oryzisoli]QWV94735.1 archaeosortase/exosortase family protein [Geomonas oryzisoli]